MSIFTLEEMNQAINMAVDETSRKAVEVLSSVLDNWVHGGDASGLEGQFSDSDKKTAENFGIDYMDVSEFVNVYGKEV